MPLNKEQKDEEKMSIESEIKYIKENPRKNKMGSKRVGFYFIAVAMVVIILYFID
jgi:hypothetical protein|tara:strand:- start:313 stop:477 length:165 start_codon:yes stop_codon:yes gene_type:complete